MQDSLPIAVGRRVRDAREQLGLSQEALAERAHLHRNYVGRVERGESDIGLAALSRVVAALGLSLAEFFEPFTRVRAARRG